MKKVMIIAAAIAALTGCATKSRTIDIAGMFLSDSGQVGIGSIEAQGIPEGTDAALIKYSEDYPWLPSVFGNPEKIHEIGITLTGTNAVDSAEGVVKAICGAFVATQSAAQDDAVAGDETSTSTVGE